MQNSPLLAAKMKFPFIAVFVMMATSCISHSESQGMLEMEPMSQIILDENNYDYSLYVDILLETLIKYLIKYFTSQKELNFSSMSLYAGNVFVTNVIIKAESFHSSYLRRQGNATFFKYGDLDVTSFEFTTLIDQVKVVSVIYSTNNEYPFGNTIEATVHDVRCINTLKIDYHKGELVEYQAGFLPFELIENEVSFVNPYYFDDLLEDTVYTIVDELEEFSRHYTEMLKPAMNKAIEEVGFPPPP